MKSFRMKNGRTAYICETRSHFLKNEICFTQTEIDYAKKLAASLATDPEATASFWAELLNKKGECYTYSLFDTYEQKDLAPCDRAPKSGSLVDHVGGIINKLKGEGILK